MKGQYLLLLGIIPHHGGSSGHLVCGTLWGHCTGHTVVAPHFTVITGKYRHTYMITGKYRPTYMITGNYRYTLEGQRCKKGARYGHFCLYSIMIRTGASHCDINRWYYFYAIRINSFNMNFCIYHIWLIVLYNIFFVYSTLKYLVLRCYTVYEKNYNYYQ